MNNTEINNILNQFVSWPFSFTIHELLDFSDPDIEVELLQYALFSDSRFIRIKSEIPKENQYLSDSTLFKWFANLNIRLAQIHKFRLNKHQVGLAMSHLCHNNQWIVPSVEIIRWGESLGFIVSCYTSEEYAFPLAHILSYFPPEPHFNSFINVLQNFGKERKWKQALSTLLEQFLHEGFSNFNPKTAKIVQYREGLNKEEKKTLTQLGLRYRLTRERVRQIEYKFYNRIQKGSYLIKPFLSAFLCDFMQERGSLIIDRDAPNSTLRMFFAKLLSLPYAEISHTKLGILTGISEDLNPLKIKIPFPDCISTNAIAEYIEHKQQLCLSKNDVGVITKQIATIRRKYLKKSQRVYLALHEIGRPAHYSEVTKVYNNLFPDDVSPEYNIHAVLNWERHGIVWIGMRGTFALKKWGYEHPSKTLFRTVAEIVKKNYKYTGKPVPFSVIMAEIGKYRKIVNSSSLVIAANCNPLLQCISRDLFIPQSIREKVQTYMPNDQLDKILCDFEKKIGFSKK